MTDMARWLAQAAADPNAALSEWGLGRSAQLVVGRRWDLVETGFWLSRLARTWLRENGCHVGVYLVAGAEHSTWWPVPLGTGYRLVGVFGATVHPAGWELRAPAPCKYLADRLWILPFENPGQCTTLTAAADLRAALQAAEEQLQGRAEHVLT
ncbi:hypothetical protein AB0K09_00840 [Streptomyces sp. NPDC049577]|uniref:hypothetical protein n=1 Tax=Streptomyces sp. NPDC049577 TaxID=3155153 RepID=UPI00341439F4